MRNYIITSNEYEIATRRLKRLYDKRDKLKLSIEKTTSSLKDVLVGGSIVDDKMSNYVAELDEVEREIKELEEEVKGLEDDLNYMDSRLSNINEIKEQVFVMYFIKGMKVKHIAPQIPCGKSSVYRYIEEINSERMKWEKIRKI